MMRAKRARARACARKREARSARAKRAKRAKHARARLRAREARITRASEAREAREARAGVRARERAGLPKGGKFYQTMESGQGPVYWIRPPLCAVPGLLCVHGLCLCVGFRNL